MSSIILNITPDTPYEEEIKYTTLISEGESGKEQRYQKWLKPRRTFKIHLEAQDNAASKTLWDFYQARKGSFDSFLFQNPTENPVSAERFGSGDGSRSVFYVGNSVGIGTGDLILTPSSLVVTRSVGGSGDFLSFSAYSIVETLGQITTNSPLPSGDVLRGAYNFLYPVRFKDDNLTRENFSTNLYRFGLDLIEVI